MKSHRVAALRLCLSAVVVTAQVASAEVIRNGGFESTYDTPNRWSGVDKDGFISGFAGTLAVLGENGGITERQMPVAVAVADINGDGLPDIMTSDVFGYIRAYANSGSKEQPKFTSGILTTPYLGITDGTMAPPLPGIDGPESSQKRLMAERNENWFRRRLGVKLSVAEIGEGRLAMVAGNYFGEIFLIPQSAAPDHTRFPQPEPVDQALLPMSKGPEGRWGNVFAPLLRDWDGDGKADLLVGEGSFSANNVHFFPNKASTAAPSFALADRSVLASGAGREQLTPCVIDLNGDGKEDLLVSDSGGRATAYLRPTDWKKGDKPLKPSGYLSTTGGFINDANQALVLGKDPAGIHTIATGDLNGDGLFDIVVGKPNGRVAWSPNKGSKEQPKFETPSDIGGDKASPDLYRSPSDYGLDVGIGRGNFFAYANSVSAQEDPEVDARQGSRALKFGYAASAGSPLATKSFPGSRSFRFGEYEQEPYFYDLEVGKRLPGAPSRVIMMQQNIGLEANKPYTLSFMHKGSGVIRANIFVGWWGFKVLGQETVSRGARGAANVQYNHANEHGKLSKEFKPSASWAAFSENFTVKFKRNELKDEKTAHKAVLIIVFELAPPDGVLYLDDLKIAPTPTG